MQHLWAPWRMQFIHDLRERTGGCIFCEIAGPGDDRERLVLHRGERCFVVMNRYPYNNGHCMIIPYRHAGDIASFSEAEYAEMMRLAATSVGILSQRLEAEGFNCGINIGKVAGAGIVDHLHFHVVPRWCGDANFLPILGETRSMPEYLSQTYDRLRPGFDAIAV